jgi:predicted O-methyltransferase YrrM
MFDTLKRHPVQVLTQVLADPRDAWAAGRDILAARVEKSPPVTDQTVVPDWEALYCQALGMPPDNVGLDSAAVEFDALWRSVIVSLQNRGIPVGPRSFHDWNDGDAGFIRAIWSFIRHVRPATVVETGVAHGMTSRFILQALEINQKGRLWSIDKPPYNPQTCKEVGCVVDVAELRLRWTYIAGTSRRRLPALLKELQHVDLFVHDSLHSKRNVLFELETVWPHLNPGGVMVVDDIHLNRRVRGIHYGSSRPLVVRLRG